MHVSLLHSLSSLLTEPQVFSGHNDYHCHDRRPEATTQGDSNPGLQTSRMSYLSLFQTHKDNLTVTSVPRPTR